MPTLSFFICYFLRLLFLRAFLATTFLAFLAGLSFLAGFFVAFTFTAFFTGLFAAVLAVQPISGVMCDSQFAIRIVGQAMVAGLVVRAGAFDRAVVLRDVEIDRPRTKRCGERFHRRIQLPWIRPIPIGRQNCVFRG